MRCEWECGGRCERRHGRSRRPAARGGCVRGCVGVTACVGLKRGLGGEAPGRLGVGVAEQRASAPAPPLRPHPPRYHDLPPTADIPLRDSTPASSAACEWRCDWRGDGGLWVERECLWAEARPLPKQLHIFRVHGVPQRQHTRAREERGGVQGGVHGGVAGGLWVDACWGEHRT